MISLAALLETSNRILNLNYWHLFQVIENICVNKEDLYKAFKRMCFNVLYKNKNDHGKKFSFLYDENLKGYKLSPAYGLTTLPNKFKYEMTVNGNSNPTKESLLEIAKKFKFSIKKCKEIIESAKRIIKY